MRIEVVWLKSLDFHLSPKSCLAAATWQGVALGGMDDARREFFLLGVKAIPLCSANAWQAPEQSQTSTFGCSSDLDQSQSDSDLEIQSISINCNGEPISVFNVYLPPNGRGLNDGLSLASDKQTIILGELNAKNTLWGCTGNNQNDTELLEFADDRAFMFLNDKSHTHSSYSYATSEALDVSIVSSDLSSKCRRNVLDNIGSVLDNIGYNSLLRSCVTRRNFWIFIKANLELYRSVITESIEQRIFPDELEHNWLCELESDIKQLDSKRGPSPDGFHGLMITNIGSCAKQNLLNILNQSWSIGRLPRDWKRTTVILIRKVNKPAGSPDSHRPVALTNIICKVLDKLVLNLINFHLESNNLFPAEQYGFRKGHCTQDQILFFTHHVKDAQNKKPSNHTIAILFDLTTGDIILSTNYMTDSLLMAKKRLNIGKFISCCEWGADAGTLRTTYISPIRPILEHGYQVYQVAYDTNLDKLERVQLSAARIVTGLRGRIPADMVLYEADLQPLRLRSTPNLTKYFSKLFSYNNQQRTANILRSRHNNQRLKKSSPLGHASKMDALHALVEFHSLKSITFPLDSLPGVFFRVIDSY
ncbi:hypothetical protein AVEN_64140-1 [Araneus ventricosus]|uniref:Endonuclease/exonuclease/phosphatase domain-containing protein n=1 Tax=Araneus ventricosus TaxID=182803 RepID=A0A4Y2C3U6_ARAVE|nr:hypothetical protein AVEN_64140-1 [Araneus ventricosus]